MDNDINIGSDNIQVEISVIDGCPLDISLSQVSMNVPVSEPTPINISLNESVPIEIDITPQGKTGPQGPPGEGMPAGGSSGDVLAKSSDADYELVWRELKTIDGHSILGPGNLAIDKTYKHEQMTPSDCWTIEHGLNKYPAVFVINNFGEQVIGSIEHASKNIVVIRYSGTITGTAILN